MHYEWQVYENWLVGPWPDRIRTFLMEEPGGGYFSLLGMRQPMKTFERIWGWTDGDHRLEMLLLKRRSGNFQLAGYRDRAVTPSIEEVLLNQTFGELIAPESLIGKGLTHIEQWQIREGSLLGVLRQPVKVIPSMGLDIQLLTVEDLPKVVDLYKKVFKGFTSLEVMQGKIETGMGRGYGIWLEGCLISVAQSDFESTTKSVIVGVATEPELQGRGYGGIVLSHLCQKLQAENQTPCLLYDNPDAGKLYRALGFVTEDQLLHIRKK